MTYAIIPGTERGGYIYHDGFTIKGFSFVRDEEFAKYDVFRIPMETTIQFVQCELDHTEWFVWGNASGPALYRQTSDEKFDLTLDLIGDQYERLPRSSDGWVLIKLYQDAEDIHRAVFQINTEIDFQCDFESLPFIFTVQNDSSAILHTVEVPVAPLLADGVISVPLAFAPQPTDVHTRRVFPSYSVIDCAPEDNVMIAAPLGGHFVDLMRCDTTPLDRGLRISINRSGGVLRLALTGTGVEVYDRPMDNLRLLFSMPGDPSLILYAASVPIATLRDGIAIDFPRILHQPFDLWLPLLYRQVWIEEFTLTLIRCTNTPMRRGLQVAVDRTERVLRLSLIGNGVEPYDRSCEELQLLFSIPGDPLLMLHATSVPLDALQNGVAIDLPTILEQPFDLWLPALSYRQAWVVEA